MASRGSSGWDFGNELMGTPTLGKKVTMRADLTLDEQREWEKAEMEKPVNFGELHIDPAPFQLVEKSNLLKVHSLFSMLGVNLAYVTAIGRLIGVVGLKELREAIEGANHGGNTSGAGSGKQRRAGDSQQTSSTATVESPVVPAKTDVSIESAEPSLNLSDSESEDNMLGR